MLSPLYNHKTSLSFGIKLKPSDYSQAYSRPGANGVEPDEFILKAAHHFNPVPEETEILDIGAGDGRNSIALAEHGFKITANEICLEGRNQIKQQANVRDLNNLKISKDNILSKLTSDLHQYHFAFMAHVSQHFSPDDLKQALTNIHKKLKDKGVVIFDALIRKKEIPQKQSTIYHEQYGSAHFNQKDIEQAAIASGYNILMIHDTQKPTNKHASYLQNADWGGAKEESLNRPVKLKWVVLQKKEIS
jgi:2-polyprenyl-3-methyl-5-hydroxy-6-metoxy-1,4-benzoquinol methylase